MTTTWLLTAVETAWMSENRVKLSAKAPYSSTETRRASPIVSPALVRLARAESAKTHAAR